MSGEFVEKIEIWMPVEKGGEAYRYETKQNLKLVAYIVNGIPIRLEEDFVMERSEISEEEAKEIIKTAARMPANATR